MTNNINPFLGLAIKLIKNMSIIALIYFISKYVEFGEFMLPQINEGMPKIYYVVLLIPWVALAFLYPFTKYFTMIFISFLIPKKYNDTFPISLLLIISHVLTITIWVLASVYFKGYEYYGPNSRAEHFLGL
jgi:hypothetical protein